jgi:hypothetical protein
VEGLIVLPEEKRSNKVELKSIINPASLTLGEAEELRDKGAYLEMSSEGWIYVYEGGTEFERDTGYFGLRN